jgi:putative transposase
MAYVKIWVHLVFCTQSRTPFLYREIKQELIHHIIQNAKSKDIFINIINGTEDHLHCLLSLGCEQNISKVVKMIKGESSFWMNKNQKLRIKFEWADKYFAVSIGESQVDSVKKYIMNQEEHHKKSNFMNECAELMRRYGFEELD